MDAACAARVRAAERTRRRIGVVERPQPKAWPRPGTRRARACPRGRARLPSSGSGRSAGVPKAIASKVSAPRSMRRCEVLSVGADPSRVSNPQAGDRQDRLDVAGAERRQAVDLVGESPAEVRGRQHEVERRPGRPVRPGASGPAGRAAAVRPNAAANASQSVGTHAEATRAGVAASLDEELRTGLQRRGGVEVDRRRAPSRAARLPQARRPRPAARAPPPVARRSGRRCQAPSHRARMRSALPSGVARPAASASSTATAVSSRRVRCDRLQLLGDALGLVRALGQEQEMASSASAMRPAALMRGATPNARSRAVGPIGPLAGARQKRAQPGSLGGRPDRPGPDRTMARLSPVIGARSAIVPMAATPARSATARLVARASAEASL